MIEEIMKHYEQDPDENYHPETCTKPHCRCVELAEKRNGGDPVKSYPCLAKADLNALKSRDQPAALVEQEAEGMRPIYPLSETGLDDMVTDFIHDVLKESGYSTGSEEAYDKLSAEQGKRKLAALDIIYEGVSASNQSGAQEMAVRFAEWKEDNNIQFKIKIGDDYTWFWPDEDKLLYTTPELLTLFLKSSKTK